MSLELTGYPTENCSAGWEMAANLFTCKPDFMAPEIGEPVPRTVGANLGFTPTAAAMLLTGKLQVRRGTDVVDV
jgi:hypothetical protein